MELDFIRHKATRGRKNLGLTSKEFMLLSLLARRKGEPLSRDLIAREVWDMTWDSGTNVVDVHVRRLRSKVDDPFEPKLIHTVHRLCTRRKALTPCPGTIGKLDRLRGLWQLA